MSESISCNGASQLESIETFCLPFVQLLAALACFLYAARYIRPCALSKPRLWLKVVHAYICIDFLTESVPRQALEASVYLIQHTSKTLLRHLDDRGSGERLVAVLLVEKPSLSSEGITLHRVTLGSHLSPRAGPAQEPQNELDYRRKVAR